MSVTLKRLAVTVTAHAWNADRTKVAICPNTNEIQIFRRNGGEYVLEETLKEHDSIVTGLDWGRTTNRILSCSHDRNAYVWTLDKAGHFKPMLVLLRLDKGATCCAWSPKEDKFAVGSAAAAFAICYFDPENNWWVSKHIKDDITSTITCLDWHPNNVLIAVGGTQSQALVFSGFVRGIDNRQDVANGTAFGDKLPFGKFLAGYSTGGWVQAIKWSPSGNQLAWACQDSTLHVLEAVQGRPLLVQVANYNHLPFRDIMWVGEDRIVGVGHDNNPSLFNASSNGWAFGRQLDEKAGGAAAGGFNARNMWKDRTDKGTTDAGATESTLHTKHQNCIVQILPINNTMFSTVGLDGNLGVWPHAAVKL